MNVVDQPPIAGPDGRNAPANWYPVGAGQERFWDGYNWTEYVRTAWVTPGQPAAQPVQTQSPSPVSGRLVRRDKSGWVYVGRAVPALIAIMFPFMHCLSGSHDESFSVSSTEVSAPMTPAAAAPDPATISPSPTTTFASITPHRMTLKAGDYTVGTGELAAGTYDVTPAAGQSGELNVTGDDGDPSEISSMQGLGSSSADGQVPKMRVDLKLGETVTLSQLKSATLVPVITGAAPRRARTVLFAGTFVVGTDLAPGDYRVTPGPGQSGNFFVDGLENDYNEILGTAADGGQSSLDVRLGAGDVIETRNMSAVIFTPEA